MALVVRTLGVCPYREALLQQEALVERKLAGDADDYLLLVEHEAVFTLGRGADERDLRAADSALGVEAIRVGRGGGVTFHGPGQLVAYPIISLERRHRDVRAYVRGLERVLINVVRRFGVDGQRHGGMPGVWVRGQKIASVGVGIRRWVTFHGIALNVSTDLTFFSHIVTCRTPDLRVTSLEREIGEPVELTAVGKVFIDAFRTEFEQQVDQRETLRA